MISYQNDVKKKKGKGSFLSPSNIFLGMECTMVVEGREIGTIDCPLPQIDMVDEKYCCGDGA